MKGDFSRLTFDPAKHYTGVLHQQGRVWLDSDWNEDVLQRLDIMQQQLLDIIGANGFPSPGTAFQLAPSTDPNNLDDFRISGGRCYVRGILCELEDDTSYLSQPDLFDPPRIPIPTDGSTLTALVYLEVWQRLITTLEDDSLREVALGGPDTSARIKTVAQIKVAVIPNPQPNLTCAQAPQFLPAPGQGRLTTLQPTIAEARSLCQMPDPANFTGRENHLFRVQIHDAGDVSADSSGAAFQITLSANANAGATSVTLSSALNQAQTTAALRNGFITIADNSGATERVALLSISGTGNTVTLGAPLQGSYTVANGAAVTGGVARFKWSRDNAAFAVAVTDVSLDRKTLTLASLGRDAATALQSGDLVEITDDASELGPARGHLTFITAGPDPDQFTIVIADPLPLSFVLSAPVSPPATSSQSSRHLVLRRWEGTGDALASFDIAATPGMNMGDGVHIQFSGSDLHAGDYWNFTTRSADGSVQALTNAVRDGTLRNHAPLAIVTWGPPPNTSPPSSPPAGVAMKIQDCRSIFPSLINFPQVDQGFHVVGLQIAALGANPASQLVNDTNVHVDAFGGIDILCDDAPDPASVSHPTCYLTADFPIDPSDQGIATAYFRMVLAGSLSVKGNTISWRPLIQTPSLLNQLLNTNQVERGVLVHLNLRGDLIWSLNDSSSFLDGEVFGFTTNGLNNISINLPSGDRRRGGDFSMWFWIVAAPSFAQSITAVPTQMFVNDTTNVTVNLSAPAPAGSNAVAIVSSNPAVASVPSPTVAVPAGATSVSFQVAARAIGSTNISATFPTTGGQTVATTLVVQALPQLTGQVVLSPPAIFVGNTSLGTITLSGPAPSAGMVVALSTNNVGIVTIPPNVTVAAGNTSANFTAAGESPGVATISATLGGITVTGPITVTQLKNKEFTKDIKDKDKTEIIEKAARIEKVGIEKAIVIERVRNFAPIATNGVHASSDTSGNKVLNGADTTTSKLRAFIRPEERPQVEGIPLNAGGDNTL